MLVNTTHGEMDDSELVRLEGGFENDHERTTWVEYWLPNSQCTDPTHDIHDLEGRERVHRSAHVTLKEGLDAAVEAGVMNGGR